MKAIKKPLTLPLLLTVLVIGGLLIYSLKNRTGIFVNTLPGVNTPVESQNPSTATPDARVADTNGIYTNKVYGFEFKYPAEIFSNLGINTSSAVERTSDDVNDPYILDINVYKYQEEDKIKPGFNPTLYFAAIDKSNGEKISQYDYKNSEFVVVGTKIADINSGVFYEYKEMFEDHRLGLNYYSADWLKGDIIVSIKVAARSTDNLTNFRPQFEKIIQSFKFVELK